MNLIGKLHSSGVHPRRVRVLAGVIASFIPQHASVLDIGCGDGLLSQRLIELRPDLTISGLEVGVRPNTRIPVECFDGYDIPLADNSVDVSMLVDVVHHSQDPGRLLAEAKRVTRQAVVIKDHFRRGWLAQSRLTFMDWFGNSAYGVAITKNYWCPDEWDAAFAACGLRLDQREESFRLYPPLAEQLFGKGLHFVARLV